MLSGIFAVLLILSLAGCGGDGGETPGSTAPSAGESPAAQPSANGAPGSEETAGGTGGVFDLQILFVNVGKADSALITLGGRHYLVDTGTSQSLPRLVKALRSRGVETIEAIFLSHTHEDHTGGLTGLIKLFDVKNIYAASITTNKKSGSSAVDEKAQEAGFTVKRLKQGDEIVPDNAKPGVKFTVAGPVEFNSEGDNDNSLVLYLKSGDFSCLFTGDMQFAEEKTLLAAKTLTPCTVLKVGNHGNQDATSHDFVSAVSPEIAVISTDSAVDTDTPAPIVLSELGNAKAKVYVTQDAKTGILVDVKGGRASAQQYAADEIPAAAGVVIESIDKEAELLVLRNTGGKETDLFRWWLLSERGGDMFFFPKGTVIAPGGTLSIASGKKPPAADLTWEDKNVWHDKKDDAAVLYDPMGNEVYRKE